MKKKNVGTTSSKASQPSKMHLTTIALEQQQQRQQQADKIQENLISTSCVESAKRISGRFDSFGA